MEDQQHENQGNDQYQAPEPTYNQYSEANVPPQQPGQNYSQQPGTNYPTGYHPQPVSAVNGGYRTMNKHLFVWIGAFLLGGFGVDRFLRGQVAMGVFKLLFNWITLGIWGLIDWIIAMVKAYGEAYGNVEEIEFDPSGAYTR
ncbi:MAG: TM2 domain-containing protein [Acidobacteriota bacterium]|nr:TM2 domain-containing protein [Acidobacteriota bacterium]